mmetsp:Transcript_22570/g.85514  ORF Transcript_22570/g.85514 Transcript_22570/m.85514 type:complete len:322 (-) Transcript_22570:749-1714(-)
MVVAGADVERVLVGNRRQQPVRPREAINVRRLDSVAAVRGLRHAGLRGMHSGQRPCSRRLSPSHVGVVQPRQHCRVGALGKHEDLARWRAHDNAHDSARRREGVGVDQPPGLHLPHHLENQLVALASDEPEAHGTGGEQERALVGARGAVEPPRGQRGRRGRSRADRRGRRARAGDRVAQRNPVEEEHGLRGQVRGLADGRRGGVKPHQASCLHACLEQSKQPAISKGHRIDVLRDAGAHGGGEQSRPRPAALAARRFHGSPALLGQLGERCCRLRGPHAPRRGCRSKQRGLAARSLSERVPPAARAPGARFCVAPGRSRA